MNEKGGIVITNYEYMKNLTPSKLAIYLRKNLAGNQGCPPCSLLQVFSYCNERASCDECWWKWLLEKYKGADTDKADNKATVVRCLDCRWGAAGDNGHPFAVCMHPRFYGAVMDADEFCSEGVPKYVKNDELKVIDSAKRWALRMGKMTEDEAAVLNMELKRRGELNELNAELARRAEAQIKEEAANADSKSKKKS